MTLIVEDGSIVANANSYVTLAEVKAFATARNVTLATVDATIEGQVLMATDYLEAQRSLYKGSRVSPSTQALQWPRQDVFIDDNFEWPADAIPKELKNAQCQLVIEMTNGVNLMPTRSSSFVIHEKVGAIETRYSDKVATSSTPDMPAVYNWLEAIMDYGSVLTTMRI